VLHDDDAKNNDDRSIDIEVNADTMQGNESKLESERANGGCG